MSIPPLNKLDPQKNIYDNPSSLKTDNLLNLAVSDPLARQIAHYRKTRSEAVQQLEPATKVEIEGLSRALEQIFELTAKCCVANQNFSTDPKTFDRYETQLEEAVLTTANEYKDLGISFSILNSFFSLANTRKPRDLDYTTFFSTTRNDLEFEKEKILNRSINIKSYKNRAEKFRRNNVDFINKNFQQNIDLGKTLVTIGLLGEETHNKGELPLHFMFYDHENNNKIFELVYKPRNAHLDATIIELFKEINKNCPDKEKLPSYKIFNLKDDIKDVSLWEFISGPLLGMENSAATYIEKIDLEEGTKNLLRTKLERLEVILRKIGISDLHGQNVIMHGLGTNNPEIIPIDLESLQPGNATGLYGNDIPEIKLALDENELALIELFLQKTKNLTYRVVAIPTARLQELALMLSGKEILTQEMITTLIALNYEKIDKELLETLLLDDMLGCDCPLLTQMHSLLYYGPKYNNNVIAQRKN